MSCLGLLNLADSFDCAEHTHYVRVQRSTAHVYWEWWTQKYSLFLWEEWED